MKRLLSALLLFNALTAVAGGVLLVAGINTPPETWLAASPFSSYVVPGILLGGVVGGSALLALVASMRGKNYAASLAIQSGAILLVWIVGELVFIQRFSWLQVVYILSGLGVIALVYRDKNSTLPTAPAK